MKFILIADSYNIIDYIRLFLGGRYPDLSIMFLFIGAMILMYSIRRREEKEVEG
jgi:hypothetical protein